MTTTTYATVTITIDMSGGRVIEDTMLVEIKMSWDGNVVVPSLRSYWPATSRPRTTAIEPYLTHLYNQSHSVFKELVMNDHRALRKRAMREDRHDA